MRSASVLISALCLVLGSGACSPDQPELPSGGGLGPGIVGSGGHDAGVDAGADDAGFDGGADAGVVDKAANCASTFGDALTNSFGRLDGTVTAIVKPSDTQCTFPNNDHVTVQVRMNGAIYRMVVNVESTIGDPDVRFAEVSAPLLGPAWSEGWHENASVDYAANLGVHASTTPFMAFPMNELVQKLDADIPLDAPVSVYATSSGGTYASSAHLVHRNGSNHDGAIVLNPESAHPTWMLFHFSDQVF